MTDLPPGWELTTLGEIAETSLGKMLDRDTFTGSNAVPYLRNINVQWGRFKLEDILTIEIPPEQQNFFELRPGDLMVCEGGEIGRCAVWPGSKTYMAFQKALHRVRPRPGVDARFLRYLLEHYNHTNALVPYSTGSTIKHLPQQQLRRLPLPLPPLAEQRRTVSALEEYLSHLDAATEIACSIKSKSSTFRKSLLVRMFDLDNARLRGWSIRRLGEVVLVASGSTPRGIGEHLGVEAESSIPFYKVGDMNLGDGRMLLRSRTYLSPDSASRLGIHMRPAGTVLLPKRGGAIATNKKAIMGRGGAYDLNIMGLVPTGELDPPYLWWWLQRLDLASISDGSNVPQINYPDLAELFIPVPTKTMQEEIVAELDDQLNGTLDSSLRWVERRSLVLRNSLLGDAFAGCLVPQDPNDEPASVLLDRIKAERAVQPKPMRGRRSTMKTNPDQESML